MIIYGEYLFAENLITGIVITFFTGKIVGEKLIFRRVLLTGICCGIYSFVILADLRVGVALAGKIAFSILAVWIAFGGKRIRYVLIGSLVFIMVTLLYGGTAIALLSVLECEGVSSSGGLYLPHITYITVMSAATVAALVLWLASTVFKEKRHAMRTVVQTTVAFCGKEWHLQGYIDSGNFLREPVTGRPVCIVSRQLMKKMLQDVSDASVKYTVIPYNGLGISKGMLEGYRGDYVKIPSGVIRNPILAVCGDDISIGKGEDWILLHRDILERGMNADFIKDQEFLNRDN